MSKAFTKEDAAPEEVVVAARPPLPAGVPNYVTPRGLTLLRSERQALEAARVALRGVPDAASKLAALSVRLLELEQRISSAQLVEAVAGADAVVRFGSRVRVLDDAGNEHSYQIVGVDEADPSAGKIAFLSPLAQALLGARVGESVRLKKPGGDRELELLALD